MRLRCCLVVLSAALALAGCVKPRVPWLAAPVVQQHSELDVMMYGAPAPPSATVRRVREVVPVAVVDDGPYTLDTGDKLRIVVFGQDALSNNYIVDAEGQVALPLIGAVNARGLTTRELAGSIKSRLAQGYIREPSVAVEVEVYRPFFILGEVIAPGLYPYVPNMTVETAVAIAGGFTPRARRNVVTITRNNPSGQAQIVASPNAPLSPGDTVAIGERWF